MPKLLLPPNCNAFSVRRGIKISNRKLAAFVKLPFALNNINPNSVIFQNLIKHFK